MGRVPEQQSATAGESSDLDRLLEAEREAASYVEAAVIEARRLVDEAERDAAHLDADPMPAEDRRREFARKIDANTTETLAAEERVVATRIAHLEAVDAGRLADLADWLLERVLNRAEQQGISP